MPDTPPREDRQNRILVLGAPRSGTTVLRRLLNAHPEIASPPETYLFTAAARFLATERIVDGGMLGVVPGLALAGFGPDEVRERLRDFVFGFHDRYAAREGKTRWAEKTAVDVFHLDQIDRLCGAHITYVCLVRHGLDVACSTRDLVQRGEAYLRELHGYVARWPRPLEAFCHAWVDACGAILDLVERRPEQTMLLRYEDLVADPQAAMHRLMAFLGTAWDEAWLPEALGRSDDAGLGDWRGLGRREMSDASIGRWQQLSRTTRSELGQIVNPMLARLGYEAVRTAPPIDEEEALRRFQMALKLRASRNRADRGG
jgi:hypothetical protein